MSDTTRFKCILDDDKSLWDEGESYFSIDGIAEEFVRYLLIEEKLKPPFKDLYKVIVYSEDETGDYYFRTEVDIAIETEVRYIPRAKE